MSTPSWEIELVKINNAQNPAYALVNLVQANPDVAMQIPPADVLAIIQGAQNPAYALKVLVRANAEVAMQDRKRARLT